MKEVKNMSDDEINRTIAELCGAKWMRLISPANRRPLVMADEVESVREIGLSVARGTEEICQIHRLPNYVGDLNAMHEAEKSLESYQLAWMAMTIVGVNEYNEMSAVRMADVFHATARQRAEAFVETMRKKP